MAEVTSGKLTAVILSSDEAEALGDLLHQHETLNEDFPVLDDLANALAGHSIDEVDEAVQARPMVAMAGRVTAAFATGRTGSTVEIWCQSPTGGDSDSQIFRMDCASYAQADMIAAQWQARWSLR